MFYLIVILGATVLVALGNFGVVGDFSLATFGNQMLAAACCTVSAFCIDGIAAFVVRRMPKRWFAPEAPVFTVGKRECELYRRLRINVWKNYIPELGCFTGFHKDKLRDPTSSEYLGRFLLESNYGVLGHVAGAFLGFFVLLLPFPHKMTVAFPIACVNFILSMLPTMVLRFHTPSLRKLYRRSLRKQGRAKETLEEESAPKRAPADGGI